MPFEINFLPTQPPNEQAEAVLDTVGKAIQSFNYKELLTPYAISIREQYSSPPIELINLLRELAENFEIDGNIRPAYAVYYILQFLEAPDA